MPSTLDDYEVLGTIGSGSYGTCKKIKRKKDGKALVWKEMDYGEMSESEKQMLVSEVNLLRELKHQHIVRYYDRIIDRARTRLFIIMEYCEGGDLASLITNMRKTGGHVEEEFVWRICLQTIKALKECHNRKTAGGKTVLHRDLKPANVFLDGNKNVKLGDFGLARVLNHDTSFAKTFVGTPYYMSPEQMNYMSYNEKSDIWSLGCLLYEVCALRPPFTAGNQKDLASRICVGSFSRLPIRYSNDLNRLITFMLQVDETKRPSIEDLLQHPLIVKNDASRQPSPRLSTQGSSGSDEGYSSREDLLKKREEMVKQQEDRMVQLGRELKDRERRQGLKEKELESREKTVALREKIVEERMSRAERLMQEYTEAKLRGRLGDADYDLASDSDLSGLSPDIGIVNRGSRPVLSRPNSCLLRDQRPPDSPKKHVSFTGMDKENMYNVGLMDNLHKETDISGEPQHSRLISRLQERLERAEIKSEEYKKATQFKYQFPGYKPL